MYDKYDMFFLMKFSQFEVHVLFFIKLQTCDLPNIRQCLYFLWYFSTVNVVNYGSNILLCILR
jgi:hypothetical protein